MKVRINARKKGKKKERQKGKRKEEIMKGRIKIWKVHPSADISRFALPFNETHWDGKKERERERSCHPELFET